MKNKSLFIADDGTNYAFPFVLISCLFLLWGFAHALLDVLNKHFQDSLELTKAQSGMVQASAYGAYFLMGLPAGFIARRYGYRTGVLVGLSFFALGCFWFVPAVSINTFAAFLFGLLIIFSGLTCLETVANPYATLLGNKERAVQRINLAQTFNALGWILGPLLGSLLIFKSSATNPFTGFFNTLYNIFANTAQTVESAVGQAVENTEAVGNRALIAPYVGLGIVVSLILLLFFVVKLPEVTPEAPPRGDGSKPKNRLFETPHFTLGVLAQFLYVAAQTGIGSFFINYVIEVKELGIADREAGTLLGLGGMGLFALGRFVGSMWLRYVKPSTLVGTFALINAGLMLVAALMHNHLGIVALLFSYFFMSVMFPSIFAMSIRGLGDSTKTASSFLVMTVAGGAICPPLMGYIGSSSMSLGFIIPLACFLYVSFYGYAGSRLS